MNIHIEASLGRSRTIVNADAIPRVGDYVGVNTNGGLFDPVAKVTSVLFHPTDEILKKFYIHEKVDVIVFVE